jgi:phytoene dehydrogenase-like protein
MGGLLAAKVLSEQFAKVSIFEREPELNTTARKGVPQGHHAHGLLTAGYWILQELFPNIKTDFLKAGAVFSDVTGNGFWFQNGGYLQQVQSGLEAVLLSRPALESIVRARVLALPNVILEKNVEVFKKYS